MSARHLDVDETGHRVTGKGETIHAFRRVGDSWVCRVSGCQETRDKNGRQPKVGHLRVVGK